MMLLNDILSGHPAWLAQGNDGDVVLSCRVRLARNIKGVPFPAQASETDLSAVLAAARSAVDALSKACSQEFICIDVEGLKEVERMVLVEKHLISPLHAANPRFRAVIVSADSSISIMVNEEDHFRIQVMKPGLDLSTVYEIANQIDDILEEKIDFAFDEDFGYLTACPTNIGTALRATAMLHMPGLVLSQQVDNMARAAAQVGLNVRGMYGEGSEVLGDIFQVSNQLAMGYSESELIDSMTDMVKQVASQERLTRKQLFEKSRLGIEDMIWRAYGVLSQARLLENTEAMNLYSKALLGVELGILPIKKEIIYQLMVCTRPNHILEYLFETDLPYSKDQLRANMAREKFSEVTL